jgi:hypothetical protein
MCRRADQLVLNDADAGIAVGASAGTPSESLKESCSRLRTSDSPNANPVVAALVAALVVAGFVGLESACGSVARLQVPAGCGLPLSTVPASDFSVQKTINDYVAGVF